MPQLAKVGKLMGGAARGTGAPFRLINLPAGVWDPAVYPLEVYWNGSTGRTNFDPSAYFATALGGTKYYVNLLNGSDVNPGTNPAAPLFSANSAITKGNATSAPYCIEVAGSGVNARRLQSPAGSSSTVVPTQRCVLTATEPVTFTVGDTMTLTVSGSFANCYQATLASFTRAYDPTRTDFFGNPLEYTRVADGATANATPDSIAQVGGIILVNRAGGTVVTNANCIALRPASNLLFGTGFAGMWVRGPVNFMGGLTGCVASTTEITGWLVLDDVNMRFSGNAANLTNCLDVTRLHGLIAARRCTADTAAKDGFGYHFNNVGTVDQWYLIENCIGLDNGRFASTSNNGFTAHNGVSGIIVNGSASYNYGVNVHMIDSCKTLLVGVSSTNSLGDIPLGGTTPPRALQANDTAETWCVGGLYDSLTSIYVNDTAKVHLYNTTTVGPTSINGSGVIDTWDPFA